MKDLKDAGSRSFIWLFMIIQVILIIFKLTGVINLKWWWVTLPLWGGLSLLLGLLFIIIVVVLIMEAIENRPSNRGRLLDYIEEDR